MAFMHNVRCYNIFKDAYTLLLHEIENNYA